MVKKAGKPASPKAAPSVKKSNPAKWDRLTAKVQEINRTKGLNEFAKIRMGNEIPPVERIRTGILTLDTIMGGGLPRGRFTQFKGADSCFKTTAILHAIREVQAEGGTAVYVQGEEFDRKWAATCGVDLERLHIISVAEHGGRSLEQLSDLIDTGLVDLAVVDSIQGLSTERELDDTAMGASGYGSGGPQMWGQWTRRVTRAFNRDAKTAVIWTSQLRSQPGKYSPTGDTSDGTQIWALKHAKAVDVLFRKGESFKVDSEKASGPYARDFSVRADKNKTAHPNQTGTFRFYFRPHEGAGPGVDTAREAAILGQTVGKSVKRSGAWYSVDGERVAQGIENLVLRLRQDDELLAFVVNSVYESVDKGGSADVDVDAEPEVEEDGEDEEEEE